MLYLSQLKNSIKLVNIMQGDCNLRKVDINQTKRFGATTFSDPHGNGVFQFKNRNIQFISETSKFN